eukprot:g5518.t1
MGDKSIPRSDVALLHRERGAMSGGRGGTITQSKSHKIQNLPPLRRDMPPSKRQSLFKLKLELCSVRYDFDDPHANKRALEQKRQVLLELVKFTNNPAGQKIFTEAVMPQIISMLDANIFRDLQPQLEDFDPEEDEPVLESSWPHLQAVYEFMLRFIVSTEVKAKVARKYLTKDFCKKIIDLFDSEDPRERDYLKTILHRIYGKFMTYRSLIRRYIQYMFYKFVYETERHHGIGELLEILGSIINGFALPLKREHEQFLARALIPLHKPKCVMIYHLQLSYCMTQFVEKEPNTSLMIISGLVKFWPYSCSSKQVLFLNELEDLMELIDIDTFDDLCEPLFTHLARCLDSTHFQVQERSLYLWNNEHLVNSGCLSKMHSKSALPLLYPALHKMSTQHWNANVENLAQNVMKLYMAYDLKFFNKVHQDYLRDEEARQAASRSREQNWLAIDAIVREKEAKEERVKDREGKESKTESRFGK